MYNTTQGNLIQKKVLLVKIMTNEHMCNKITIKMLRQIVSTMM